VSILYDEAVYYKECGLSVLPIADRKRPDGRVLPNLADEKTGDVGPSWKPFQFQLPDDAYLRRWFRCREADEWRRGIGIIGGKVSGNLVVLDFEDAETFEAWLAIVDDNGLADHIEGAPIGSTPGGGMHITLRSTVPVPGNTKLAYWANREVRIETRGEGGYVAAPPSQGVVHPTGGAYVKLRGSYATIPVLEPNILNGLIGFCTFFNEWTPPERIYQPAQTVRVPGMQTRPGDDFNERGDIRTTLEAHGWHYARRRGDIEMWTRPGKDGHDTSATLGYGEPFLFYVFSSNAAPFDGEKCYSIFAVKAILDHGGDFQACAKELAAKGYGASKEEFARAVLSAQRDKRGESAAAVISQDKPAENDAPSNEPAVLLGRHELTDTGNANRFVRMWRDEMRYDHSVSSWFVWNGRYWEQDFVGLCMERAKKTAARIYAEAAEDGLPDDVRTALVKHAKTSHGHDRLKAMIALAKSDPSVAVVHDVWDKDPWLLNVENGTLELRSGTFREHQRSDMLTHMSRIEYNPIATCPTWDACLAQWQPQENIREFLRRGVGYSLTGNTREQKLFYLYGSGSNGKSVFLEACQFILGGYWLKSKSDSFMRQMNKNASGAQPDLVPLIGKRFVTTSEVAQSERLNEALVKDLTGGDTFAVRDLYRGMVNFTPQCKIWFYGNHKPRISSDDGGIWRRFLLVNFGVIIPEDQRDPELLNKLRAEASGILNWALAGLREWMKGGLKTPDEINRATAEYRQAEDVIGRFIDDALIISPMNSLTGQQMYQSYTTWCKANGEFAKRQNEFSEAMKNRGFNKQRVSTGVKYIGVGTRMEREIENLV